MQSRRVNVDVRYAVSRTTHYGDIKSLQKACFFLLQHITKTSERAHRKQASFCYKTLSRPLNEPTENRVGFVTTLYEDNCMTLKQRCQDSWISQHKTNSLLLQRITKTTEQPQKTCFCFCYIIKITEQIHTKQYVLLYIPRQLNGPWKIDLFSLWPRYLQNFTKT